MAELTQQHNKTGNFRCILSGPLTFYTVHALCDKINNLPDNFISKEIDLSGVQEADSSAFLVLFSMMRWAESRQQQIIFVNIPVGMLALMKLYDLENIIPHQTV
jgi:ABC-type transporter Mla MlaB component